MSPGLQLQDARTRMKVLHVAETAKGGVGSYIEEIVPLQIERSDPAAIRVVLPREHAAHFAELPPSSLRLFDVAGASRLRCMLRMAIVALDEIKNWQPDVVHVHSTYAGFVLRPILALCFRQLRVIYCAHGWAFDRDGPRWMNRIVELLERQWSRWCDAIICISHHDARSAERVGIDAARIFTVINGVANIEIGQGSKDATHVWPAGVLKILFVGRMDRQKGIDVLFDAMRVLSEKAFAVVVGASVVAEVDDVDQPSNVRLTGWLPRGEIAGWYAAADVVVVPSRWEGFGLVAVEAMRAGKPVIASRVGGLAEVVEHGTTGVLLEEITPACLAETLLRLTAEDCATMGRAGRKRYERLFAVQRVVDELDAVYRLGVAKRQ